MSVLLYVDDIVIVGENRPVAQFVKNLQKRFKVKTKDIASEFIGIEIDQDFTNQQNKLHQSKHIQDVVDRFALKAAKAVTIPIDAACLKDFSSEPNLSRTQSITKA